MATMNFYDRLLEQTEDAQIELSRTPIIEGTLRGEVSLPSYVAFLRCKVERCPTVARHRGN